MEEEWAERGGAVEVAGGEGRVEEGGWRGEGGVEEEEEGVGREGGRVAEEEWGAVGAEGGREEEGGRVEEEEEPGVGGASSWCSGEGFSVALVSSVLLGILLSSTSTVIVSCFSSWISTISFWDLATLGESICLR